MNLTRVYLVVLLVLAIGCQSIPNSLIHVETMVELQKAIDNAEPGHEIVIKEGIWKDVKIELKFSGTKQAPIIVERKMPAKFLLKGNRI